VRYTVKSGWSLTFAGSGDVIEFGAGRTSNISTAPAVQSVSPASPPARGMNDAVQRAINRAMRDVPSRSRVALVEVQAMDGSMRNRIQDIIEEALLDQNFRVVDRSELERIRAEQDLQTGGDFDERQAVSIGRFAGANYILTARVDREQVRIRLLNVTSGEVEGIATEEF
jgi:hypothetical protein